MALYRGHFHHGVCHVTVRGRALCPRFDLQTFSASGFGWGRLDARARQLALALLADHCGADENRALEHTAAFAEHVVAELHRPRWTLLSREIEQRLQCLEGAAAERAA